MEYIDVHEASKKWNMSERRITSLCRDKRIIGAKKTGKLWSIPADTVRPLDGRTKEYENQKKEVSDVEETTIKYSKTGAMSNAYEAFSEKYRKPPMYTGFTPYRICPIGAHSDHQLGKITGFVIDKGIYISYSPKTNGVVEITSLQFPKRAQWHVLSVPDEKQDDWADYLRGATAALGKRFPLRIGMSAVIDGELPIGGLSSSAAVIITFLNALASMNGISLTKDEMVALAQESENKYVGVACGKLDQSCEVYAKKDHLLYMDLKDDSYELIAAPKKMKPYKFGIFFSGVERSLATSKFNMRVDECRSAAYALCSYGNIPYGKFEETNLRDVPYEVFCEYKDKLPDNWRKRAQHWYSEFDRVEKGAEAWRKGDIEKFGALSFESGLSSINNWETGGEELIKLYDIMTKTKGIYGGRFSGAGFKGCCMAMYNPEMEEEIFANVRKEYLKAFPNLESKFSLHSCVSANGVKLDGK